MVNICALKKVPFFLALFAAEQMNAVLTVDDLIEAAQKKYFLTLRARKSHCVVLIIGGGGGS